ncbi:MULTISPECIES: hypothetical protein [Leptospira]|uniref:Uncharacterized protein n=2 Tax=Leptospira interrogans TaxID=173 RepID=A0A0E2DBX9_LEPIR|nr:MULTISPECIES: hypothetical protein [Leptospira]EKR56979.1 hypothetical protein LEP1GSC105_0085 [Leptospira interrogans str. UI 12758]EMJ35419.1 hypothetical protein LEP1GSC079_5225 [Leptospira interrogans str. FPW1039]EMN35987.1 hypothetical protein LEP1GSC084_1637 [Leptospira interrogans serovar Medanensis str. L0448]EMN95899.1 hypothetical protein LEP1GSC110_0785 [Leptospira interrogans serovar Medanensis str. UT053]UNE65311.1 hypothetical protein FH588_02090 [Leptospira interrogans]
MIQSEELEVKVQELEKKGYNLLYIEDYVKGYFEAKIEISTNLFKEGASLEYVLNVTGFREQELKDYGVI